MAVTQNMIEKRIADFAENYMEKLFYFCLKKTGNSTEAEDLTQEIAMHILTALSKGTIPSHFSAWVWQIARNRYSVWADDKHRKAESVTGSDIGDYEIVDDTDDALNTMIHREQLALLRRELAFIGNEYRNIVVAYYMDDVPVREIAASLGLSEGAVKQRLYRARMILKEGMNMAREFGTRSYKPEEVNYSNNCICPGGKGQPYSIMEHVLYQNILLEAYGNPSTADTLAPELGVALPYMEDELEYLTRETFLIKKDGKYQTAFPIVSRSAQERVHAAQLTAAPDITKALMDFIECLNAAFIACGYDYYGTYQDYESAKWSLLMLAYDHFLYQPPYTERPDRGRTERPDGGRWDMTGYQHCSAAAPCFVGNHGSGHGFQQFRYEFDGIQDRTPPFLTDAESKVLSAFVTGKAEAAPADLTTKLAEYGYLNRRDTVWEPAILVLNLSEIQKTVKMMPAETVSALIRLADQAGACLKTLYETIAEVIRADLPAVFAEDTYQCGLAIESCYFSRGYVMAEALRRGYLLPAESVSPAIGAHLYL